ncbi:type II toxin-antitoxin system RatA family toxin [Jiella endophytica]|uniref:Type II toxin-antitoxin system RatA family toxin n=1 Tax=Jiella endophytica TaxID=2558362 RepID=A0A4Y8REL0_9HYPH|nr:type II toxin-antitoxin system RatA family toxin [Jiella endophytica]TFF20746.1 type II toxin-antitoxin system RatA family toxin [Jiella endophytica]TFF27047.1 type II toxin-antitoxin system RatA family toxin [Jiella endophytica]
MPKFETTRHVHHTADEMFALVADVEKYPEFLPLCQALTIRQEREKEGKRLLVADMTVAYKMVRETFTSQVLLKPEERRIEVSYVNGPFRFLDNRWDFVPTGETTCDVKFFIEYEFKSRTLGMLMGSMFDYAFRRFATAFEERADKVYG